MDSSWLKQIKEAFPVFKEVIKSLIKNNNFDEALSLSQIFQKELRYILYNSDSHSENVHLIYLVINLLFLEEELMKPKKIFFFVRY